MRKQNEELTVKLKATTKENETLKTDAASNQSQINELKDQVSLLAYLKIVGIVLLNMVPNFSGNCHSRLGSND